MAEPVPPVKINRQRVFERTWSSRGNGMWGVAALGLVTGLVIGLIAPFFPVIAGLAVPAEAMLLLPKSLAIFSALGMSTGFGLGVTMGIATGSTSGAMEEGLKHLGVSAEGKGQGKSAEPAQEQMSVEDTLRTYINPRVGLVMTGVGMVGGAILAGGYFALGGPSSWAMPAMETLLGPALAKSSEAVTSYFVGLMGSFGALWFLNYPKLAGHFQNVAGNIISGKWLGREWGPAPAQQPEQQPEQYYQPQQSETLPAYSAREHKAPSYNDMLAYRERLSAQSSPSVTK